MIKFVYPEKDTFVSNHPSLVTRNFGKDEVLEVEKRKDYILNTDLREFDAESRALVKFDLSNISQSLVNGNITNPTFRLKMKVCEFVEVPQDFKVIVTPISQSWKVGTGRFADEYERNGVSWRYRFAETQSWVAAETSQSISASVTQSFVIDAYPDTGPTEYSAFSSRSVSYGTGSITITSLDVGDNFYVTSSVGGVYTFVSNYNYTSQSVGYPSASYTVTSLNNFDRYIFNGLETTNVTVVNEYTPNNCKGELFVGWYSDVVSESNLRVEFTTSSLHSGKKYVLSDSITSWSFIATNNPYITDTDCGTVFFYVNNDNYHNVASFSMEINSVENFYLTSSVSSSISGSITSSYLIISGSGLGELGDDGYFLDYSDYKISSSTECGEITNHKIYNTQSLSGGTGSGFYTRFNDFVETISTVTSSLGFTFNTVGYTLFFTSSYSGSSAESFNVFSGSTQIFFGGSYISSSYSLKSDDVSSNLYYFETSSVFTQSISNLVDKLNNTLDFISVNQSGSDLTFTGSIGLENIGFQSGSSQVVLNGAVSTSTISSSVSQSFLNETADLDIDVTDIVYSWLRGDIPNEGFVLKNNGFESTIDSGKIRFYSKDTNTIYVPRIEVGWDDQTFSTGSLKEFNLGLPSLVKIKSMRPEYKNTDVERFRILARNKYPGKTYGNQFTRYTETSFLPVDSQFAVKDAESEEFVINFSGHTKISCDSSGSFFDLDMSTLPQERYYNIYIKVNDGGLSEVFESNQVFKISR